MYGIAASLTDKGEVYQQKSEQPHCCYESDEIRQIGGVARIKIVKYDSGTHQASKAKYQELFASCHAIKQQDHADAYKHRVKN